MLTQTVSIVLQFYPCMLTQPVSIVLQFYPCMLTQPVSSLTVLSMHADTTSFHSISMHVDTTSFHSLTVLSMHAHTPWFHNLTVLCLVQVRLRQKSYAPQTRPDHGVWTCDLQIIMDITFHVLDMLIVNTEPSGTSCMLTPPASTALHLYPASWHADTTSFHGLLKFQILYILLLHWWCNTTICCHDNINPTK